MIAPMTARSSHFCTLQFVSESVNKVRERYVAECVYVDCFFFLIYQMYSTSLSPLEETSEDIFSSMDQLRSEVTLFRNEVAQLRSEVAQLRSEVAQVYVTIEHLRESIRELRDIVVQQNERINVLESRLAFPTTVYDIAHSSCRMQQLHSLNNFY